MMNGIVDACCGVDSPLEAPSSSHSFPSGRVSDVNRHTPLAVSFPGVGMKPASSQPRASMHFLAQSAADSAGTSLVTLSRGRLATAWTLNSTRPGHLRVAPCGLTMCCGLRDSVPVPRLVMSRTGDTGLSSACNDCSRLHELPVAPTAGTSNAPCPHRMHSSSTTSGTLENAHSLERFVEGVLAHLSANDKWSVEKWSRQAERGKCV